MYYNTTNETGNKLAEYEEKALTQDDLILEYFVLFADYPDMHKGLTPSAINDRVLPNAPVTSVRRSMNALTKQGKLIKTAEKRTGPYGRPEHVWKLAK